MEVVLVRATGPDPKLVKSASSPNSTAEDGETTLTCSGLLFDDLPGLVITSLAPVLPFLRIDLRARPAAAAGPAALLPGARLACAGHGFPDGVEASMERVVEVPGAAAALRALLTAPSSTPWGLGWGAAAGGASVDAQVALGSHVAVLRIQMSLDTKIQGERGRSAVAVAPLAALAPGGGVVALGCPFGALVSLKFRSFEVHGIISSIVGGSDPKSPPPIALADLRCLPGMEGGAVVAAPSSTLLSRLDGPNGRGSEDETLIGLLAPPLRAPEAHAEAAVVVSAAAALGAVRAALGLSGPSNPAADLQLDPTAASINETANPSLAAALHAVVAVDSGGGGWASGVLVSAAGHVLTAAHALPTASRPSKSLKSPTIRVLVGGQWRPAAVAHAFPPLLDLAVLRIEGSGAGDLPPPVRMCPENGAPRQGQRVLVAGFPLWRPRGDGPLVTAGAAALVAPPPPAAPAAVVTTAAVHAGASGGPVFDSGGALVALVTSNTRLVLTGVQRASAFLPGQTEFSAGPTGGPALLFPHLNYCLGPAALAPAVRACAFACGDGREPDWAAVEAELAGAGVVEAWHSMRSMEGPQKGRAARGGPPRALAALLRRGEGPPAAKL